MLTDFLEPLKVKASQQQVEVLSQFFFLFIKSQKKKVIKRNKMKTAPTSCVSTLKKKIKKRLRGGMSKKRKL